ncbi:MAG TPA: Gmad2 immunoglobulin-like domain-containing protein [Acidimicrobiales bacterium]|nr:Gmad2 immunoglobulin-like domain-containing protein [Acidimicrobiales bacterium]
MTNRIDQPRAFDLVGNPILVGGVATGFEATVNYRVHEGHDEVTGFFTVGGGTGEHGQYQLQVDVAGAAFTLERVFVEVFEVSAADGSEIDKVIVPVVLGSRIVPNYTATGSTSFDPVTLCGPLPRRTTATGATFRSSCGPTRARSPIPT